MTLHLDEYVRKPFVVQAARVTAENIDEVATWCGGKVKSEPNAGGGVEGDVYFIKVDVKRPLDDRQTRAYIGDYVLSAGRSFKVYTEHAFKKSFDPHVPVSTAAPKRTGRTPRPRPRPTQPGPDLSPIGSDTGVHPAQMTLVSFQDAGFPNEPVEMREEHIQAAENVGLSPAQVQSVLSIYNK